MAIPYMGSTMLKNVAGPFKRVIGILIVLAVSLLASPQFTYASSDIRPLFPRSSSGDWPTYMMNNEHTGFNANETILNATTVPNLKPRWRYQVGVRISSQPVIANNTIYWGSWDGYEHATNLNGQQLWQTYVGITMSRGSCSFPSAGVPASATVTSIMLNGVATTIIIVNGGSARVYALKASDGSVLWSAVVGTPPDNMLWGGTTVYNDSAYIGVASYGDCPLVTGKVIQLDTLSGTILHSFSTMPTPCRGAGIWMTPTIDIADQALYVSTGNKASCRTAAPLALALVKLSTTDLSLLDSWQLPLANQGGDNDFGNTPTLFTATIHGLPREMVGVINKDGVYYAFDRAHIGAGPLWQQDISTTGNNIASSAWDGSTLYTASMFTTINGTSCKGAIRAHDPATGAVKWAYCAPGKIIASLGAVPGVIFAGAGNHLIALNAATGTQLFAYTDTSKQSAFQACCSISNGVLYAGTQAGTLYAFGL